MIFWGRLSSIFALALLLPAATLFAAEAPKPAETPKQEDVRILPAPRKSGGMPLMDALAARRTQRELTNTPLTEQQLSNLLWAAFGITREDGRRTAPTAMNRQDVNIYVAMPDGVWLYDAKAHALERVLKTDLRQRIGGEPLALLYAAPQTPVGGMHIGSIYQNVGLYCAATGLGNVVRTSGSKQAAGAFPLPEDYVIQIVHSVGHTK